MDTPFPGLANGTEVVTLGSPVYNIALTSKPSADVTVNLAANSAGAFPNPASVTFTPGTWNVAQKITVQPIDDDYASGNKTPVIVHTVTSDDANFDGITVTNTPVTVLDDDVAGVLLSDVATNSPNPALALSEGGNATSYYVRLTSRPATSVTLTINATPAGQVVFPIAGTNATSRTLTFTNTDWSSDQTVVVQAVDDNDIENSHPSISLTHQSSGTGTQGYDSTTTWGSLSVAMTDNDNAGILTSAPALFTVNEGGTNQIGITLKSRPSQPVTVQLSINNTGAAPSPSVVWQGGGAQVTFSNVGNDWNTPKLFDVTTGTDVNSASEFFQIIAQVVGSSDGNYYNTGTSTGISTNVAAQCLDKDQPGITIQQRTAANSADDGVTTVTEGVGAGDRLQVRLNVPATAAGAYVLVQATTDGQTTVSPSTLIFDGVTTPYLNTQTLTIQAVDDNVYQGGTRSGTITFQVTATNDVGAPKYTTFINSVLPITITDNDTRGVSVSPTTGLVTTEAGGQAAFGVRLLSQPSAGNQVVVTLASGNPTEVLASPTTLTFLPANWNIAQTITLTGQPDQVADGDKTIQVSLAINTVTTTDPFYLSQVISPVSVTNVDVDTRAIVLSATALSLSEATAGGTYPHSLPYTLRLQSKPTGTVTINLANNGQIAVSPTSLKFGPIADLANGIALWSAAQTIQVTATNDDIDEDGIHQTVVTHTVAGADYTGVLAASVTVSIEDNDTAGVLVTGGPLIVREGVGTPLYPTVVSVTDGTGTPTNQIQLPAGTNLTTAQVGAKVRLFALNAAIGSPNSGKLATITAINSTTKTIRVAETLVANPTGGDEVLGIYPSFTVALRSQPTANVVVPLSSSDISAGALVQSNLLFTPVNWQTTQVVTVYGVDDSVAQGTRNWTAQVERAQSADTGYAGLAASGSPAVSTLDDDTAGFTITPGGTVHVNEAGVLVATMGISLSSQPTAAVAAALTAGTDGAGKVQGALNASSLTFDAINWNTVQNFTITGIANGDNADNGSAGKAWSVSVAATSTDTGYSGVTGTIAVITDRSNAAPALPKPSNLVINEDSTATTVMVNGVGTGESGEVQGLSAVLTAVPANVVTLGTPTIDQVAGTLVFTVTPIADQNGTVTVTIALTDDAAIDGTAQTTTQNFTVTVTAVNDAPVIDVDGPGAASTTVAYIAGSFIEKAAAVAVVDVSALIVSDIDSATLISATAVLAAAPDGSSEILAATAGSGLNTTWNSTTRTLTIQAASPQPLSAFQSVLRSLTYSDSSLNPTAGVRTITVQVNDGAAQSVGAQSTVTVVPVNDASVVQLGGVGVPDHAAVTYPEQSPPVAVCMEAVVSDVDNANQSGFTAMLAAQPDGSSEVLSVNLGGIAGLSQSYVGGILTVTGSATVAEYQTVLASLAYQNTSLNPTANPNRTITVVMSDGSANSTSRQTQVVVVPVNDAAVVDLNGVSAGTGWASTWTEAAGPVAIVDPAALTISDVDSATATQARVILTSVPDGTAESLSVTATGLTVSYVSGTLSLVGTAPLSTYETVLRTLSYDSSSRNPTGTSRTVTVEINDGTLWSASATAALTITPVNDQPVVDLNGVLGGADVVATHTEGQAPALQPFNAAILTDVDNSLLSALTVTATSAPLPDDGTVVNGAAAIEDLTFDTTGTSVTASWSAAAASLTLLGPATVVEFQQVLRTVAYRNTSKSPAPTTRVFTVRANDGSALSGAQTATINVVSVNDVPQVQVGTLAVTRAGTVLITSRLPAPIGNPTTGTLAATDVETAAASLVFTLTLSPNQGKLQRQVGVLWNDVVPSSTFTQQEVLNGAIRYVHSNGISSSDGFAVTATDGNGAVSAFNVVTIAINVGLIQPVVTLQGADPSWTEGTGPVVLNTNATVNDPDFIDLIGGSLTVNVTGGVSGTASLERLAIRNQGTALGQVGVSGSTVTYSGVVIGTIATDGIGQPLVVTFNTFTNTDAVAAIIANLTWDFVGKVPGVAGTNDRSITFVVDDGKGGTLVTPAVRTVAIIPVNDPPAAAAIAFTTAKGLDLAASVQPADPEGLSVTVTKLSNPLRGAVTMQTDGSFVYSPYAGESGADTFTVRLNDGAVTADQVVSVRITGGSDARPWITSDPPMETRVGELLRYGVQADDSEVPAGTTVLWELVGAPTGMTISSTGPLTSAVQWTAVMPTTTSYVTFSIVARISASSGVAVQTVTLKVLSTPVGGG